MCPVLELRKVLMIETPCSFEVCLVNQTLIKDVSKQDIFTFSIYLTCKMVLLVSNLAHHARVGLVDLQDDEVPAVHHGAPWSVQMSMECPPSGTSR